MALPNSRAPRAANRGPPCEWHRPRCHSCSSSQCQYPASAASGPLVDSSNIGDDQHSPPQDSSPPSPDPAPLRGLALLPAAKNRRRRLCRSWSFLGALGECPLRPVPRSGLCLTLTGRPVLLMAPVRTSSLRARAPAQHSFGAHRTLRNARTPRDHRARWGLRRVDLGEIPQIWPAGSPPARSNTTCRRSRPKPC